jgi:hypothetical protein
MAVFILGDSNMRNTWEENKERLTAAVGEAITFKMATSNESLKAHLEGIEGQPKMIFIMTPLNEVVKIVQKMPAKGRDETLRSVIGEMGKIVHNSAKTRQACLHILIPPFLRLEPNWFATRVRLGLFYVKENITKASPWNIAMSSQIDITEEDLGSDKIHLNEKGKEKFYQSLEHDILKCKEILEEDTVHMDWASQLSETHEPPTPNTMRKRTRNETEEDEEDDGGRKKARLDTILDKIDGLVKEIKQDRAEARKDLEKIELKVEENCVSLTEVKAQVETIQTEAVKKDVLTAEMREDIDGLENENLKQVVVVRKLKAEDGEVVPRDTKALKRYIQNLGRKLVASILNDEVAKQVKYAAPLYSFIDPTKKDNQTGLVPPFKIGFLTKDAAVRFRDAALKEAKKEGSVYKKTYFTFFQSPGTRIRVMILWSIADKLKSDKRDVWVSQNTSKPALQVKESGRIIENLSYVKAVNKYGDKIPSKTIEEATKIAKRSFSGNLKQTFVVLND